MAAIRYTDNLDEITPEQLEGFFVGWPQHPTRDMHYRILASSYRVWLALDGDRCVGFCNALSDGVFYAYIPLLEVLPEYQRRGIGKQLALRMIECLREMYAIDLLCDEAVAPFYTKLGLHRAVGMAMRNYRRQSGGA